MNLRALCSIALLLVGSGVSQAEPDHSPRLAALAKRLAAHEAGAEDAFWRQLASEGTPIIEDAPEPGHRLVSFVWRGAAANKRIQLIGPVAPPQAEAELTRLPGSSTFATTLSLPDTGRFTYSFMVDGNGSLDFQPGHLRHDPFAKHQSDPMQSLLELPHAPGQPSLVAHPGVPAGSLWRHSIVTPGQKRPRQLLVYTPAGYSPRGPAYPLLVAFDAETMVNQLPMALILDELIAAKRIPPVVALFVGNVQRMRDLVPNAEFADLVALDLVPWMRAHYHATSDPGRTVISGISLGGLASAYAALRHPEVYGNVLSQSGSFWWGPDGAEPEELARDFATTPRLPLRVWMEVGTFELGNRRPETTQLAANRHFRDVLRARGYDVTYQEFAGNHTYVCWRGTIADGLAALLGRPSKLVAPRAPRLAARPALEITPAVRSSLPVLVRAAIVGGPDAALAEAKRLQAANSDGYVIDEDDVNNAGFHLVAIDHARESLGLLRWNTERFPQSANAWDSVAWAYYFLGDRAHAIETFKEDARLDPKNDLAAQLIKELTVQLPCGAPGCR